MIRLENGVALTAGQNRRPLVHIIVVNWNNWPDTLECVESLRRLDYPNYRIFVIDNGSIDPGPKDVPGNGEQISIIRTDHNLGFAGGVNVGLRIAVSQHADYAWILNNDTTARPDALRLLVQAAEKYPEEMFVGSWVTYYDRPTILWFGAGRFRWATGAAAHELWGRQVESVDDHDLLVRTSWITGCSILVRRTGVERIGLLDESYFLYREELEWQLRGNPKHPRAILVRAPLIRHKIGRSTGTSHSHLGTTFMSRNYLKLMKSYAGPAAPLWMLRWLTEFILKPAVRGDMSLLAAALKSVFLINTPGRTIVERSALSEGTRQPTTSADS